MHLPTTERTALLLAHPGHELVVHRFVEQARPLVAILTDGSGAGGESRVDSTTRVLEPCGASPASLYARYSDGRCYAALLARDAGFFIEIAEELAEQLIAARIELVVGDAAEGWNPVHDVWRSTVDTAITLVRQRTGRPVQNFDFLLFSAHPAAISSAAADSILLHLDDESYRRKLDAGAMYTELHAEVNAAMRGTTAHMIPSPALSAALDAKLAGLNAESYRVELLRRLHGDARPAIAEPRVYELYGEMLVAQGRYAEAIRYNRHLLPIEIALQQHAAAERESRSVCAFSLPTAI
jgi:hypothetical protein